MCGRSCLTLKPSQIMCSCKYKSTNPSSNINNDKQQKKEQQNHEQQSKEQPNDDKEADDEYMIPEWRAEFNLGRNYTPSYNIAPTDITPVLVSADHFRDDDNQDTQSRVLLPMMWGMIPFWHKGDYRRHGLSTNNCRLEHMLDSKLYRGPFRRGQRCVILCEGFYEWQTTKSAKPSERAAHLLYMPQANGVRIYDKTTWTGENVLLLKMAGLFDVWQDEHGDKMYSYSIITFESSNIMSWLHHRMPAILDTEQQVNDWLDFKRVSNEQAMDILRPTKHLEWHRVSNIVNNSRNKSDQCNQPIELVKAFQTLKPPMNKTMSAWLNVRKRREDNINTDSLSDEDNQVDKEAPLTSNPPKRSCFEEYKKNKAVSATLNNTSAGSASDG